MGGTSCRPQVLYIGRFRLPDRNAAAQRVLANAKGLRRAGLDVVLVELGDADSRGGPAERLPDSDGFVCYRAPMKESGIRDHPQLAIRQLVEIIDSLSSPCAVIAYNYPAVALARLHRLCRRRGLRCAADVTEWYGTSHLSSRPAKAIKWIDTSLRMRFIQKRLDALVVISKYLEDYYRSDAGPTVIKIPPLVDTQDSKWMRVNSSNGGVTNLVWAGSFNADKERLDLTVSAVVRASEEIRLHLDVVGLTADQFTILYPAEQLPDPELVTFHGRVSHQEALARVSSADYSIIVRERSRVVDAGFPTKFVESITLGTPSLVTPHPDLCAILSDGRNGAVLAIGDLASNIVAVHGTHHQINRHLFDFRQYDAAFSVLAEALGLEQ